jgi:Lon-like protease
MTGDEEQMGATTGQIGGGVRPEPSGAAALDAPSPPVGPGPLPDPAGEGPPPATERRRRRWPWVVFIVIALAVAVASRVNLNYYAIQPGTAQSVQQFITVPPSKGHPVRHPVLLTDVEEGRVTALSYLFYKLQSDTALYPVESVTGGTPPSQLDAQGALEMSQAESAAKTAALRHLGYKVGAIPSGAVIFATFPGTPAYPVLEVGDVITAIDGVPTPDADAMSTALAHHHPGQTVTLTVRKGGTARPAPVVVTLKRTVIEQVDGRTVTVDLGVDTEDQVDYTYPFPVKIDVTNIGGPSAGLAMTLGVIDALDKGSLTGGHTVAATGTIDSQGNVGDVGGVAQKTVAVENAGASIFFVPPQEYKAAMSQDRPGLKIYSVSTLDQVLAILAGHGGSVPKTPPAPSGASG